jgi:hypothetical protein
MERVLGEERFVIDQRVTCRDHVDLIGECCDRLHATDRHAPRRPEIRRVIVHDPRSPPEPPESRDHFGPISYDDLPASYFARWHAKK